MLIPLAVFALFWVGIVRHLAKRSGLSQLQSEYPIHTKVGRDCIRLKPHSGVMNRVRFRRMLRLYLNEQYLFICFMRPFSFGFPGVQLPLSKVKYISTKGKWIFKSHIFQLGEHTIEVYGKIDTLIDHLETT